MDRGSCDEPPTARREELMNNNPEEKMERGGWRRGQKNKATDCGWGCTYRLRILGNPSGILSRRKEEPHSEEQKEQDLTGSQDAINNQAA